MFCILIDIDECITGLHDCAEDFNCRNLDGNFTCGDKPVISPRKPGNYMQQHFCNRYIVISKLYQSDLTATSPILLGLTFVSKMWIHFCSMWLWNARLAMSLIHFLSLSSLSYYHPTAPLTHPLIPPLKYRSTCLLMAFYNWMRWLYYLYLTWMLHL